MKKITKGLIFLASGVTLTVGGVLGYTAVTSTSMSEGLAGTATSEEQYSDQVKTMFDTEKAIIAVFDKHCPSGKGETEIFTNPYPKNNFDYVLNGGAEGKQDWLFDTTYSSGDFTNGSCNTLEPEMKADLEAVSTKYGLNLEFPILEDLIAECETDKTRETQNLELQYQEKLQNMVDQNASDAEIAEFEAAWLENLESQIDQEDCSSMTPQINITSEYSEAMFDSGYKELIPELTVSITRSIGSENGYEIRLSNYVLDETSNAVPGSGIVE